MKIIDSLTNFLFPPTCLHCEQCTESDRLFCSDCIDEFVLIPVNSHCGFCFALLNEETTFCKHCLRRPPRFQKGAAFELRGPASSLLTHFKTFPHLIELAAAYSIVQFENLKWPSFDFVTFLSRPHRKELELLANHIGKFLQIPVEEIFTRYPSHPFDWNWRVKEGIIYKTILILDDFRDRDDSYLYLLKKHGCHLHLFGLLDF